MRNKKAREGFFIETNEHLIFDVKGSIHPLDRIIAYLRYIPTEHGDRERNDKTYRKVYSLNERQSIISNQYPQYQFYDKYYGLTLQGVPLDRILEIYDPIKFRSNLAKCNQITGLKKDALDFTNILISEAGVNKDKIGITGSPMVNLTKKDSDIDIVIYGSSDIKKARVGLKNLFLENKEINQYTIDELKKLYAFKSNDTDISWKEFVKIEPRKIFQGTFRGIDFYIRGVKNWNEMEYFYGDFKIKYLYNATIEGIIEDSRESIYSPCVYKINHANLLDADKESIEIKEIFSYRGRFCELLKENEKFIAHGTIEKIIKNSGESYHRLIIGGKKADFLILKN
jgi:hypothetical protein